MKQQKSNFFILLLLVFLFIPTGRAEPQRHPQELVETVTNQVLTTIRGLNVEPTVTATDTVVELILPHLDFIAMSKLVLGKHWRRADTQQRDEFVQQFRDLLVRTYKTSLMKYSDERIHFLPFRPTDQPEKLAIVRSEIIRGSGPVIPMNYSLRFKPQDGWKVYDIGIEGISLVTNYRSSFAREISQRGIDQLIESLRRKNDSAGDDINSDQ